MSPTRLHAAFVAGGIAFGYVLTYGLALLLRPVTDSSFVAITDIGGVLPALVAGGLGLWASQRGSERTRWAWRLIGLGSLAWAGGECVWTFYELILGREMPFPSLADVGYTAAIPLLLAGFILLTAPSRGRTQLRVGLDALAIVVAAATQLEATAAAYLPRKRKQPR